MMTAALALAFQTTTGAPPPIPPRSSEIVVTARSLADTAQALRDCLARACPPREEIEAGLRHAEAQFLVGSYADARRTLGRTIDRMRGQGREFPVEMGELWRTKGRLSAHLGEGNDHRIAMIEAVSALRRGFGPNDPRVVAERLEVGDALAARERFNAAYAVYESVIRDARRLGHTRIEGQAMLRHAFSHIQAAAGGRGGWSDARRSIERLTRTTDPGLAAYRDAAAILRVRMEIATGGTDAVDALVRRLGSLGGARPALVFAPPIDFGIPDDVRETVVDRLPVSSERFQDQWIDLGYWIAPDGTVRDATVLRESKRAARVWVDPMLRSLRGRRYAPLGIAPDLPGVFRVERVTYTSDFAPVAISRIRSRDGRPRIVITELTVERPAPTRAEP